MDGINNWRNHRSKAQKKMDDAHRAKIKRKPAEATQDKSDDGK